MNDWQDRSTDQRALVEKLLRACRKHRLRIATAESCTGGLIASAITDVAGSSDAFDCGFVTYSNCAKQKLLNVPKHLIERDGAVSESVARHMAEGALEASETDIAVAVTGIAGPGGTATKPEGLVHLACARRGAETRHLRREFGALGREHVREISVSTAIRLLVEAADEKADSKDKLLRS